MIPPVWEILEGDVREQLARLPECQFQTAITSFPYWKLRRYMPEGHPDAALEIGGEATFAKWVETCVEVLDAVKRVLRKDGTLWLNLGDSYNTNEHGSSGSRLNKGRMPTYKKGTGRGRVRGLKHKDLIGQPWALAFAAREAGWWLRSEIIWAKPNPLPESVNDRPTKSHEHVFLLTRSERYFYDADAVREPHAEKTLTHRGGGTCGNARAIGEEGVASGKWADIPRVVDPRGRNLRDVWTIPTEAAPEGSEHFASFPRALVEPCVLAGTSERGACIECAAPWRRVKGEASGGSIGQSWHPHEDDDRLGNAKAKPSKGYKPAPTIGWEPSCKCGNDETLPCVVLDPFSGTGRTGEVALKFGRSYVGIELNPKSAAFSREHLRAADEAFAAPIFERPVHSATQRALFGAGETT